MAKTRPTGGASGTHHPAISPELGLKRLQRYLEEIPEVRSGGHHSAALSTWEKNVKIVLAELYGENSLIYNEFRKIWFTPGVYYEGQPDSDFVQAMNSGLDIATGFLQSRVNDLREQVPENEGSGSIIRHTNPDSRKIFVVHGHDHGNKERVARFLGKLDLVPIILHEQPDQGNTIIEKFEAHATDVQCAVVILTADDIASSKETPEQKEFRARQNVVLELGFFIGKLGRKRTFALVEKSIALPSDIHGVVYISLQDEQWRLRLVKELKAAGLDVDANRAL